MTWLAYSNRFTPKRLSVSQQPSGATAGQALTTQPIVQVLDGGGELCTAATNSVAATKHSGVVGTLSGTTSKAAVAGVATFTDLAMSAAENGVSIDFASSGLTGVQSSTFNVAGAGGAVTGFLNSTETGGSGGDADVLVADDLNRGWWYKYNYDRAASLFAPFGGASAIAVTANWGGTIYSTTALPEGSGTNTVTTVNARGVVNAASHGTQPSGEGADLMADHDFNRTVSECYVRFDAYWNSGYQFGAEKICDFNRLGGGGIIWGNLHLRLGGAGQSSSANLDWQGTGGASHFGIATINSGRWYSIQCYVKLGSGGADGILKVWVDDLGAAGTTIPGGGTPTLRLNVTNYQFIPASGGARTVGNIWMESWANPASSGHWHFTNFMARENNGGSNGNSPILIRAAA